MRLPSQSDERGFALVVSVLFLAILTALGVNAMRTSALEEKMAANTQHHNVAFRSAESGLTIGMNNAGGATTGNTYQNTKTIYKVNIGQGEACDYSDDSSCADGWSPENVASVETGTAYKTEAKVPPPGFSLDGPFATHHFRIDSSATYGTTQTQVSRGFRRLGPRAQ